MRFCMSQTQDGNLEDIDLDKLTADKIRRRLTELEDDTLELELMVEVRALSSAWFTKYVLQLKPISLERVDVVEAKLRDVEEKLVRTEKLLADLIGKQVVHLSAVSSNVDKLNEDGDIIWNEQKCDHFDQNSERNGIICLVKGWYTLNLTVFLLQQKCNGGVTLRKNNIRLLESQVPKSVGENTSTSLGWCGLLKKNDELSVIATENPLQVGAELMMMRLSEAA
ncbi:hypothetical protein GN244_ATG02070 [Phytophthora infestans]|uniref:Uncharacterized protein n=1 Tax=Phytophthora infestans TaxID=4787 RepID=A0A833W7J0_PHYIN|nr:hypothetical protein GN244_ATG02070 [Phytophthora infestans]KAF4140045.1 hypothetical protein GN958_ATG10795 [Phytophthora infestans]